MAIIPLGPLTIPSIRKLLISKPGLPGGRFSGEPPLLISLPMSGAKGSRRTIFSRIATGLIAALVSRGMSDFAAVTSLEVGGLVAEFAAAPAGTLPGAPAGFVAPAVAIGGFDGGFAPAAGFGDEPFGLAVAFALAALAVAGFVVPAADDELVLGVDAGFDAGDAALPAADVGAAFTGVCGLGAAVPDGTGCFAPAGFAVVAPFAGAA